MQIRTTVFGWILLIVVLSPIGFTISWQTQQVIIRYEMREELEKTQVRTMILSLDEMNWADPGDELLINGRLFDVKAYHQNRNGSFTFTGLFDEDETALLQAVHKKTPSTNDQWLLGKLLRFQWITPESATLFWSQSVPSERATYLDYNERLMHTCIKLFAPPPEA